MKTPYEGIGLDRTYYDNCLDYLAKLTIDAAIEIDNQILGRNDDFSCVEDFARILRKYQLRDSDTALSTPNFPYHALLRAMKEDSSKEIRYVSELALEMKLLQLEISSIKKLPRRKLESLRDFCVQASKEFQAEDFSYLRRVA